MSSVDIKSFIKNKNLLMYFIGTNFPLGYDVDLDVSLIEFYDENYELEEKEKEEIDSLIKLYDGVINENDGYVEDPNVINIYCCDDSVFSVSFHPGDTVYYIDNKMIGCTGPDYQIHRISYFDYKNMTRNLNYYEKVFILPMVYVTEESVDEFKKEVKVILADINIDDLDDTICNFIVVNCMK